MTLEVVDTGFMDTWSSKATAMDEVMEHVHNLERLQAEVENADARLKELKQQKARLEEEILPMFLASQGLDELKLANGKRLSVKEDVYCRLPEDPVKREEALAWLSENGGGEKIKDEALIEDLNEDVLEDLESLGVPFSRRRTVNTNSLTAWARDVLGLKKGSTARMDVGDFPQSMGVCVKRTAKLA